MPQKRSATLFDFPSASITRRASVSSPSAVACRKPPGGSATVALPIWMRGGTAVAITSPLTLSRASLRSVTKAASFACSAWANLRSARTLTSRPVNVAVTATSQSESLAPMARPMSKARAMSGARIGHCAMSSSVWLRASMKPAVTTPSRLRTCRLTRRRPAPCASMMPLTSDGSPRAFNCSDTSEAFHAR